MFSCKTGKYFFKTLCGASQGELNLVVVNNVFILPAFFKLIIIYKLKLRPAAFTGYL